MPPIAGKYQHYKNENIDDFFTAIGVPYIGRKMIKMASPTIEIALDSDDNMTIKNVFLLKTSETKFKLGEQYDESMPSGVVLKSTTRKVDDAQLVTESVYPDTGAQTRRRYQFNDEGVVLTLSHDKAAKDGKRYFRRVE